MNTLTINKNLIHKIADFLKKNKNLKNLDSNIF